MKSIFNYKKVISGVDEDSVGGLDYNIASQVPYMPWLKFTWTGYKYDADRATNDTEGDIYSFGMALNPSLNLDLARDESNKSDGDANSATLTFIYPPKEDVPTLQDGFMSDEIWHKASMKNKLNDKVKRNNNLSVEIQGAVIFTKK